MGFAPRFNYDAAATPGGIAGGLGALFGSLAEAKQLREKNRLEQQGLQRLAAQDSFNQGLSLRKQQADEEQNAAMLDQRKQELGLKGLEAMGTGVKNGLTMLGNGLSRFFPSALDQSRIRLNDANAQKALNPTKKPGRIDANAYGAALKARERALQDLENAKLVHKADFEGTPEQPWYKGGGAAVPAKRNYEAEKDAIMRHPDWAPVIDAYVRQTQQLNVPATEIPATVGNLRSRVSQRFGGQIPPDWEQSLQEAENNDEESAAQLEEMLAHPGAGAGVAQPKETDLLGNPQ